jgi:tetratricopeptide (TPR) repeat protein
MGVVYKARQRALNRLVALKMILARGHAGEHELARFQAEAEAVAALQHPNIVQIYEVGERDGLPYLALEYLDGGSLQQKLAGQPLPPRLAADLIEQLARAVQYAHEQGVVHRDLKPANILFTGGGQRTEDRGQKTDDRKQKTVAGKQDTLRSGSFGRSAATHSGAHPAAPVPKITDFGLAKRIEKDSGLTGTGAILGTPSYMAPEQAEGRTRHIGPPADIHALGAILYELLTGRPPFLGADPIATITQVRLLDPVPPRRVQPHTPRDLETICLKCLEKEPAKRYAAAGDLADDLRRFLDNRPILARPVSVVEKAWKWAKRQPYQAALAGLFALILIGLTFGSVALARYRTKQAEELKIANEAEAAARGVAEEQRDIAKQQFKRAEENFLSAREAVDKLLVRVGGERLIREPRAEKLRTELLESSLAFYDRFLQAHGDDPSVRQEAGWAYQRVGAVRRDLGRRAAAIAAFREAVRFFEGLAREKPDQPRYRKDLADTHKLLLVVLEDDGQSAEADRSFEAARELLRKLAADAPNQPEHRSQLAELLNNRALQLGHRRRPAEAVATARQALAEFDRVARDAPTPGHRLEQAKAQINLGDLLQKAGQPADALGQLRAAVGRLTALAREFPDNPEHPKELGNAYNGLGVVLFHTGQTAESEHVFREAVAQLGELAKLFPKTPEYRFALALAHDNLAHVLKTTRNLRAAEPERERARELFAALTQEVPANPEYRLRYARSLDEYGIYLEQYDRRPQAVEAVRQARDLLRNLVTEDPLNPELLRNLAERHLNLGQLFARSLQNDDAEAEYAEAASILEGLAARLPGEDAYWKRLPDVYANQAALLLHMGRERAAERCCRLAVGVYDRLALAHPDQPDTLAGLAQAHFALARLRGGKPAEALAHLRDAVRGQRAALALAPKRTDLQANLGVIGPALIEALADQGDHAAAARAAADLGRDLPPTWAGWPQVAGLLARCMRLARTDKALAAEAQAQAARGYGEQALAVLRRAVEAGFKDVAALKDAADLEPLRTDAEFRPAFEQVLADAAARASGGKE